MLSNAQIKNAKPREALYRIADSHGLAIEITPKNKKLWRYRYRFHGEASMISLGPYPLISLSDARILRDKNRLLLLQGINPSEHKSDSLRQAKTEQEKLVTFSEVFQHWYDQNSLNWSPAHVKKVMNQMGNHVLPFIGNRAVTKISTQDTLTVFQRIDQNGTIETLDKVRGYTSRVFRFAVGLGLINSDPTRDMPRDLFKKKKSNNFAHLTDSNDIGNLLRLIETFEGSIQVETALKMAPYVFLRPVELAQLQWNEVYFEDSQIKIKAQRMKMGQPHIVPLTTQTTRLLNKIKPITSHSAFVFPNTRNPQKSISPDSLRVALRRLGVSKDTHTTHGFRHMASTRLYEMGFRGDVIERQLSHGDTNKVKAIYNHAQYLEERREMMQKWANFLDELREKHSN